MADTVFRSRSLGTPAEGIRDQYADGTAAKLWEVCIGDKKRRTQNYKDFLVKLLKNKRCTRVLDAACGTGIDSVLLLEEGFEVVSTDASDKMLKYALKTRWSRRKEPSFDKWVIEEANWLNLYEDVQQYVGDGFDAVLCLGNSFSHLLDSYGDQREQRLALKNFAKCVKPGGLLLIDHRNYDNIIDTGSIPTSSLYYSGRHMTGIKSHVLFESGKPTLVMLDYIVDISDLKHDKVFSKDNDVSEFRLSYYPYRLEKFTRMIKEAFGENCGHQVFGDFKHLDQIKNPIYYIHVIEKPYK